MANSAKCRYTRPQVQRSNVQLEPPSTARTENLLPRSIVFCLKCRITHWWKILLLCSRPGFLNLPREATR